MCAFLGRQVWKSYMAIAGYTAILQSLVPLSILALHPPMPQQLLSLLASVPSLLHLKFCQTSSYLLTSFISLFPALCKSSFLSTPAITYLTLNFNQVAL